MGVADIDDGLGLDCQTSFNGLGAKGVYRQVLIVNFSPIKSLHLSLPFSGSFLAGNANAWTNFELFSRESLCKFVFRHLRFEAALSKYCPTEVLMTAYF